MLSLCTREDIKRAQDPAYIPSSDSIALEFYVCLVKFLFDLTIVGLFLYTLSTLATLIFTHSQENTGYSRHLAYNTNEAQNERRVGRKQSGQKWLLGYILVVFALELYYVVTFFAGKAALYFGIWEDKFAEGSQFQVVNIYLIYKLSDFLAALAFLYLFVCLTKYS